MAVVLSMKALAAGQLALEPLSQAHAEAMFAVLADPAIYRYLDYGPPPSVDRLRSDYARLEARRSPDGSQQWLNWVIRPQHAPPIGYVQATVAADRSAFVAYVLSRRYWGHGHARVAVATMLEHLGAAYAVEHFRATVERANERSIRLLEGLGFCIATAAETRRHALRPTERLYLRQAQALRATGVVADA
jgi:RimJ/RimL family protein N-acetyltransferase